MKSINKAMFAIAAALALPAMRDLGERFGELSAMFEEAIPWFAMERARATADNPPELEPAAESDPDAN